MKVKDTIKVILMIIAFLVIFISLLIYGFYRNHQIETGKMELVYQYGGDL